MRALSSELRRQLESAVLAGRGAAEAGVRAALSSLGVEAREKPGHLDERQARLRRGLRAKQRQLGGGFEVLVWDAAYERWHRLLFARFLAENGLLRHPEFDAPVTLAECEELAEELGEPDGWSVAARFAAEILPGIFRLDDPCVQLRPAPEHRMALEKIVAGLPDEVFAADDSLGWVYQYWQSERKDQVNASEVKIGGADLGPVTQLFTENYMVRFLLENSLGSWWAARHPDSPLVKEFEFLRFEDDGQPAAGSFEGWPDTVGEVTVMDPCCGSGHFLVEAFGMLWRMRAEEEELDPVAAQDAVLADNLFGLELDPRCVQIAMFAVALAAWKQGGGYRRVPMPNIACSGIPAKAPLEEWTALAEGDERLERALERLHRLFKDADTLGSLIDPRRAAEMANAAGLQRSFDDVGFDEVAPLLEKAAARETDDPATAVLGADAAGIAHAASLLARRYSLVSTNVPYLLRRRQAVALQEYADVFHRDARPDLATLMVDRLTSMCQPGGGSWAAVTPSAWLSLGIYRSFRSQLLKSDRMLMGARLGTRAFEAISGEIVNVSLMIWLRSSPSEEASAALLDVSSSHSGATEKSRALREISLARVAQRDQINNPDSRVVFDELADGKPLGEFATTYWGSKTGDDARYKRLYWELPSLPQGWRYCQTSFADSGPARGCSFVIDYSACLQADGAQITGEEIWGRPGIVVKLMQDLPATRYMGELFDQNVTALIPGDPDLLPAIWAYLTSPEFNENVRRLDTSLKVTSRTLEKVPFDVQRWRQVAAEQLPLGLPGPWSNDPTQWLFEGRPEVSTEPLQVAVSRLVGYRWPEQSDEDDLDALADDDGIVCLPAVGGEQPAADRLTALFAAAYGDEWSPALLRRLLEEAGSKKKTLADWLRDDFFKHHCKVFDNRPFVWHITDGRKDGFSALVNYHELDRTGLERLTYTYLGDWLERQRADAADEVAGADTRLAAAQKLKAKLEQILEGEPPFDIYVRWKPLHEQPIGWDPDLDDGVRLNIRPFVEADVLAGPSSVPRVHWNKDRGKNSDGSQRHNDLHHTHEQKRFARGSR